jgi:hypothetical protein
MRIELRKLTDLPAIHPRNFDLHWDYGCACFIETDPLGLEAKLIATAVEMAEEFKITKFWTQPKTFWDKPPHLP